MNANNVKAAIYIAGGAAVIFIGYEIYKGAKNAINLAGSTGEKITAIVDEAKKQAAETMDEAADLFNSVKKKVTESAGAVKDSVSGAVDTVTGNAPVKNTGYAKELPYSKWDASTIRYVKTMNKNRGRKENDFTGWQIFSDGTIITPGGDYTQFDYASAGMESADGFAVKVITGDPFASKWPTASEFLAQMEPPGFSGEYLNYP